MQMNTLDEEEPTKERREVEMGSCEKNHKLVF